MKSYLAPFAMLVFSMSAFAGDISLRPFERPWTSSDSPWSSDTVVVEIRKDNEGHYLVSKVDQLKQAYGGDDAGILFDWDDGLVALHMPSAIKVDREGKFRCMKNVGLGSSEVYSRQDAKNEAKFCASSFVKKLESKSALDKGFSFATKVMTGITSAGAGITDVFDAAIDIEKLSAFLANPEVSDGLKSISKGMIAKRLEAVDARALKEQQEKLLHDKGQQLIAQAAVGESLCVNADGNAVSGFIEAAKGKKIQLRVNNVADRGGRSLSDGYSYKGVFYKSGNLVWTDGSLWSACN